MPEFKEKTGPGRRAKTRPPGTALPRQAVRQMKEKAIRERKQTAEETEGRSGCAEEQVEEAGHWAEGTGQDSCSDQAAPEARPPHPRGTFSGPGGQADR